MAFPATDAIDEARDYHRSFTPQHTPTAVLLRRLNAFVRLVRYHIHKRDPDALITKHSIPFPLANFDAGFDLTTLNPRMILPVGGTIILTDPKRQQELTLVPWRNRFQPGSGPSAWIQADTLHFVGQANDWTEVATVDLYYVAGPATLLAKSDTVDLPDGARYAAVTDLASFMARRGPDDIGKPLVATFTDEAKFALDEFLDEVGRSRRAKVTVVREAW